MASTFLEHPSVHPQEDLYIQFYGISFKHPYMQSGRWQDVFDTKRRQNQLTPNCISIKVSGNKGQRLKTTKKVYKAQPAIVQTAYMDA